MNAANTSVRAAARTRVMSSVTRLPDGDRHALHRVVRVAAEVPGRRIRLPVACRVGRAAAELVVARGCRSPAEGPVAPGMRADRRPQVGGLPGRAAVAAHLDLHDRAPTRPGAPPDGVPGRLG